MTGIAKVALGSAALLSSMTGAYGIHWYTTPKNVADKLSKEGLRLLDINTEIKSTSESSSYQKWKKLIGEEGNSSEAKSFAQWTEEIQEHEKIKKMRLECKKVTETLYGGENYDDHLKKAKQFCVEENDA